MIGFYFKPKKRQSQTPGGQQVAKDEAESYTSKTDIWQSFKFIQKFMKVIQKFKDFRKIEKQKIREVKRLERKLQANGRLFNFIKGY